MSRPSGASPGRPRLEGVILAAGRGQRMGRLGSEYPKALLPVGPESVIGGHLSMMRDLGVRDVTVVVGHRGADVAREVGDGSRWGLRVDCVEQGAPLGSAHAVNLLRGRVTGPFLLLLGDYYFRTVAAERLVARAVAGASAIAVRPEPDTRILREACEVRLDREGRVSGVVEKPMRPEGRLKGCGVYLMQPEFFDAVARTPRTALRDEYEITEALDLFVRMGAEVWAEPVIGAERNMTRPDDVLEANLEWLDERGRPSLVLPGGRVDPEVRLVRSVVCGPSRVRGRGVLEQVVVLAGADITVEGAVRRAVASPAGLHAAAAPGEAGA